MLTEERHSIILDILNRQKSVSLSKLCEMLDASESTIRRDLILLDESGLLTKVRGGAISVAENVSSFESNVEEKANMFLEEKTAIARGREIYILGDHSKFGKITSVKFAELGRANIITDKVPDKKYLSETQVKEVF